jgi:hypothetical protein
MTTRKQLIIVTAASLLVGWGVGYIYGNIRMARSRDQMLLGLTMLPLEQMLSNNIPLAEQYQAILVRNLAHDVTRSLNRPITFFVESLTWRDTLDVPASLAKASNLVARGESRTQAKTQDASRALLPCGANRFLENADVAR